MNTGPVYPAPVFGPWTAHINALEHGYEIALVRLNSERPNNRERWRDPYPCLLIEICEHAIVPMTDWWNRDTQRSQERIGTAWALLKAGCPWRIAEDMYSNHPLDCAETIWIRITYDGFNWFEDHDSPDEEELFYLPTMARLERAGGSDWY